MKTNNRKALPKTASFLRARREAKDLTLRDMESLVGLTYSHVCRIELGARRIPLDRLDAFAEALDIDKPELRAMAYTEDLVPMDQLKLAQAILKQLGIEMSFDAKLVQPKKVVA